MLSVLTKDGVVIIVKPLRSGGALCKQGHECRAHRAVTEAHYSVSLPQVAGTISAVLHSLLEAPSSSLIPGGIFVKFNVHVCVLSSEHQDH
jgi:hypothetical protein